MRAVAYVNGVAIPRSVLDDGIARKVRNPGMLDEARLFQLERDVLERLITRELIQQAVAADGIIISQTEIDDGYEAFVAQFKENFADYVKHAGLTREQIVDDIRLRRGLELLLEKRLPPIADAELRAFYTKNERFYTEKAGIRASHILIKLPENASPEEEAMAMEEVTAAQERLRKGEDFEKVATELSEGPAANEGGDLGFFSQGYMVKEFEDVAFAMKVGEVRGPVRTYLGYHFIKLTERREDRVVPFDEVREQIRSSLRVRKLTERRGAFLQELRDQAQIELVFSELTRAPAETMEEPDETEDRPDHSDDPEMR